MKTTLIAIVPAAGIGSRALDSATKAQGLPKQYRLLGGQPMLRRSVQALLADERISQVRVAVAPGDIWAADALQDLPRTVCLPCGGQTRAETVLNTLQSLDKDEQAWVLVHDAARPGLPKQVLARLIDTCLQARRGGLLALPVADTVKRATPTEPVAVQETVDRDGLWLAQTPQLFPAHALREALQVAKEQGFAVTDEASAMELAGSRPLLILGSARNFKVTWPEDFELMEKWL
ncbi:MULTISPECIES: 2-C-methyl-D-erythritol 4-phosphate cytidylyltransferase [Alcaligenes]|jgi:2-C-methyl-D-erythritol 4-phosphate cytidylyltransferase|uniref:2-C-methyl-D-erythritol 4-phosphate cytidylyltransferase n=1 Tax=Alcaligenes TaxID=507 RepID=UPI000269EBFC|nr:2-C-methyl-D-erythritol 4-phosphate cytidylyltransferase [Alcaligenes faecalis subsp. faecalis NCIB 8687]QBH18571.1 2-C-methyl-D-erythritol 4-phosphate cytidylyltransferase [Alcaligenes faecalis]WGQ34668.1 2-C-methyl-D-erythritol 4-phosphate cytidylyltransferase [Alcaligenes faecalis]HRK85468.1 2-C-methyl-D-erythritol 4-phosphate cytidylyltransferase [Alcaligenes faecalis]